MPKIDGRKSGNHKVYAGNIDIALKWLYQQNKLFRISTTQLGYYLKMLPEELKARYKDPHMFIAQYEEELSIGIPINDFDDCKCYNRNVRKFRSKNVGIYTFLM